MSKDFEEHDASINCTEEEPCQREISEVDQILSTVAVASVNQVLSMPLIDLDTDVSVSHATTAVNATPDEPISSGVATGGLGDACGGTRPPPADKSRFL